MSNRRKIKVSDPQLHDWLDLTPAEQVAVVAFAGIGAVPPTERDAWLDVEGGRFAEDCAVCVAGRFGGQEAAMYALTLGAQVHGPSHEP